jgi:hypothetical protein
MQPLSMKHKNTPDQSGRLLTYLSLGIGAGVIGSHTGSAQIIHQTTSVPLTAGVGSSIWWNPPTGEAEEFAGGGAPTFAGQGMGIFFDSANYIYTQNNGVQFATTSAPFSNLAFFNLGDTIDSTLYWRGGWNYMDRPGWTTSDTPWDSGVDGTTGYLAFRYDPANGGGADYDYGWAEFTYNYASQNLVLQDFAYESTVGQSITAGGIEPVPEANTGLLLAMGAAGLVTARRLQKQRMTAAA